ncbi:hypothetical protein H17ap60334_03480 [Thermosipho africanus H17ap60334]|jgi:uncharacterized protein YsxB (DUF464 family)|uniref:Ribosomal processing cysteine protease Prp n=1 Tax=Thermosipho africanus (strain TCF52B) TaxID=484019 RepID=B7ICN3_THEAB|nr:MULTISPECIES: ribosomal-processing cysteine protease Prp [Thermosipho]HCF37943.1 ribosomal-processing cysteine protease Prp [Thermosipho africanus]ACJ75760.1 ribosomal protein [Thermosipho africanus TCF52B]EKF49777.1 hypothetical protein H17ap60334_03480 [Thermosipho africanus H17ap60334]MBZ4650059.1 ribosomal protein [Thermosipho sp. (in: thermotogales)]RDI91446.1 hypothetical protein Ob7_05906 [Thermosipho africanus Ob7]
MITCKFFKENGFFEKFLITGHSMYAQKGKDIVCAAVSVVAQHTARYLLKNGASVKIKDGYLDVKNISHDNISQIFVNELIDTLKDLEEQYPKYLKLEVSNDEN